MRLFSFLRKKQPKTTFFYVDIVFQANRKKDYARPVAYRSDGKVYIIDYNCPLEVKPGERWRCRVVSDMDNKIIVDPVKNVTFEDDTVIF